MDLADIEGLGLIYGDERIKMENRLTTLRESKPPNFQFSYKMKIYFLNEILSLFGPMLSQAKSTIVNKIAKNCIFFKYVFKKLWFENV
jgi:hypothetical protein